MTTPAELDDLRAAKRAAILVTARRHFFAHGYGATSMSSIAAQVGGSKTTLWSHFRSKEALFAAVVDEIVDRYGAALAIELPNDAPVEDSLARFGSALMATALSTPVLEVSRLVISEAGRVPAAALRLWEGGIGRGTMSLAAWVAAQMAHGRLRDGDPLAAARQFVALCQSGSYARILLAIDPIPDAETVGREVQTAVDSFVRAWGGLAR